MSEVDSMPSAMRAYEFPNVPAMIFTAASDALTAMPTSGTRVICAAGFSGSDAMLADSLANGPSLLAAANPAGHNSGTAAASLDTVR